MQDTVLPPFNSDQVVKKALEMAGKVSTKPPIFFTGETKK